MKSLTSLNEQYEDATLYVGRELTKLHEEMLVGSPGDLKRMLMTDTVKQKGEFVVIFTRK